MYQYKEKLLGVLKESTTSIIKLLTRLPTTNVEHNIFNMESNFKFSSLKSNRFIFQQIINNKCAPISTYCHTGNVINKNKAAVF